MCDWEWGIVGCVGVSWLWLCIVYFVLCLIVTRPSPDVLKFVLNKTGDTRLIFLCTYYIDIVGCLDVRLLWLCIVYFVKCLIVSHPSLNVLKFIFNQRGDNGLIFLCIYYSKYQLLYSLFPFHIRWNLSQAPCTMISICCIMSVTVWYKPEICNFCV